ncbi:MAG: hypothetical protein R2873_07300 [Caldilineaceae bacterium]
MGTIASGALIATAAPHNVGALQSTWHKMKIESTVIGRILTADEDIYASSVTVKRVDM